MEAASAFSIYAPVSRNGVLNASQEAQARRGPTGTYHMDSENRTHQVHGELASTGAAADRGASFDAETGSIAFHEAHPIENLPAMASPELKMIGRCVSFQVKQSRNSDLDTFYYVGLVSAVTATTVTLMHANRYTGADFKAYKSREKLLKKNDIVSLESDGRAGTDGGNTANLEWIRTHNRYCEAIAEGELPVYGYNAEGEGIYAERRQWTNTSGPSAPHELRVSGSLAPLARLVTENELETIALARRQEDHEPTRETGIAFANGGGSSVSTQAARHRRFRTLDGSCGPIPYVTFLRKNIREVEFGRDPLGSFYLLFQDPAKHIGDMQYLRMFVRRYLVHTSQGNNPRQVPLYAYLSARCAWPDLDRELVKEVVHEELLGLLKTDRAIQKRMKQRLQQSPRERMVQRYQAPLGIFSSTGILYLTRIPQSSFLAGTVVLFLTLLFAVFLGVVLGRFRDAMVVGFVSESMSLFITSLVMWTLSGVAIVFHAITGHIPLSENILQLVSRIVLTLASIGCCLTMQFVIILKLRKEALYDLVVVHEKDRLCAFYERHNCTGLLTVCGSENDDPNLCSWCPNMPVTSTSCYVLLWNQVERALTPLLVLNCSMLVTTLYAEYLAVKLLLFVETAMGTTV